MKTCHCNSLRAFRAEAGFKNRTSPVPLCLMIAVLTPPQIVNVLPSSSQFWKKKIIALSPNKKLIMVILAAALTSFFKIGKNNNGSHLHH
jgi:hypothetical protein